MDDEILKARTKNRLLNCKDCQKLMKVISLLKRYAKIAVGISTVHRQLADKIREYENELLEHVLDHLKPDDENKEANTSEAE